MMPRKWQEERDPSPLARHCDVALTTCDGEMELRITWSAIFHYQHLVLYRCRVCDEERLTSHQSAPAVALWGVIGDAAVRPDFAFPDEDDA